jgi:ribosomal protein S13
MTNKEISKTFYEIADLLDIKGVGFKPAAYRRAAMSLEKLESSIAEIYKQKGLKGIKEIKGIGESIAKKIEEHIKKGKIKYLDELKEETAIQQIIAHFFSTKGITLSELKYGARKRKIIYSRFTKPAKQLLELAGSIEKAKQAIDKVAEWANSRKLDYAIETVFKKWLELDRLKPKEIVKKPFFQNYPMIWSSTKNKWYVIGKGGEWLEFAGKEDEIEWKVIK